MTHSPHALVDNTVRFLLLQVLQAENKTLQKKEEDLTFLQNSPGAS